MKVTRYAKRRWFTPQNHRRIILRGMIKKSRKRAHEMQRGILGNEDNTISQEQRPAQQPDTPDTAQPLPQA